MRVKLWSDIHLEFANHKFDHLWTPSPDDKETTLVLAGDIDIGVYAQDFIKLLCEHFRQVIFVCGNHEFYYHNFEEVIKGWQDFELNGPANFHFLHNDQRILDGVRFLGGTMWTSFDKGNPLVLHTVARVMNDYKQITYQDNRITPYFTMNQHTQFIEFLTSKLNEEFSGTTIVITHHSPGNPIKRTGRRTDIDYAYFADIEDLIGNHDKIAYHFHGHTHQNWDYMINNTRVICNPYGYQGYALNENFDKDLIIEV